MRKYRVAVVGLGRMASTIDDEVRDYGAITLPYSIAASCQEIDRVQIVAGADITAIRNTVCVAIDSINKPGADIASIRHSIGIGI